MLHSVMNTTEMLSHTSPLYYDNKLFHPGNHLKGSGESPPQRAKVDQLIYVRIRS